MLIILPPAASSLGFQRSNLGFALIISDQCWPRLLWRPVASAETAQEQEKQLSRLVPVSESKSYREMWANATL